MLDTDPSSAEDIFSSRYSGLFHPDSVLGYKQDCKSNFFEARRTGQEYRICEETMDRIRSTVDMCENLQGFFVFRSFGGGTGAGIGNDLLEDLREQFSKKVIFEPAIYPSRDYASSIVEPYNCILATAGSRDSVDLSLMLDNQAAYRICRNVLKVKSPSFMHLNRIIAQMVSGCTTSLRFESELNASLAEIVGNLVPDKPYRYPIISLSPIRDPSIMKHESFSTREIVTDLFDKNNVLCDVGDHLKQNRLLATCILLRGTQDAGAVLPDGQSVTGGRMDEVKELPVQVKDALSAVDELIHPKGGHRQPLKFLPWLQSGGFKVGVVGSKPRIPDTWQLAKSNRQGACLQNSTAVRTLFVEQYKKFIRLFYNKSYVWQFLEASGELDSFYDAKDAFRDLIDEYQLLLNKAHGQEMVDDTSARMVGEAMVRREQN
jgi:tubulin alpha